MKDCSFQLGGSLSSVRGWVGGRWNSARLHPGALKIAAGRRHFTVGREVFPYDGAGVAFVSEPCAAACPVAVPSAQPERSGQVNGTAEERGTAAKPTVPGGGDDDCTLGGYFAVHSRPPAFEACDGQPYTVSIETERSGDLKAPVAGYLVFPRWAETGLGIVGHVESPLLWKGSTRDEVVEQAGAVTLHEVQRLLNEAVLRKAGAEGGGAVAAEGS